MKNTKNILILLLNIELKKSGSRSLAKANIPLVKKFFNENLLVEEKKSFLISSNYKNKQQFKFDGFDIQLSLKSPNKFEIRQLSNTYNRNVIFSIISKQQQDNIDLLLFKKELGK